ncbi:MAG: hypothetical protein GKR96_08410 [Gammaproteobacteria bacterium]|nr:hypothetical protein [Gammaproteobacteria bacterium]
MLSTFISPVNSSILLRLLIPFFVVFTDAYAESPIGEVSFSTGDVTIEMDGVTRHGIVGEQVYQTDTVLTGFDGYVVLNMFDKSKLTLRPRSVVVIEEYRGGVDESSIVLRLLKGGLKAITGQIAKKAPKSFSLKTPTGSIGIRGTEFISRVCGSDCREEELQYEIQEEGGLELSEANVEKLFPDGVYTLVTQGVISMTRCVDTLEDCESIDIALNQSGYLGLSVLSKLKKLPRFLTNDFDANGDAGDRGKAAKSKGQKGNKGNATRGGKSGQDSGSGGDGDGGGGGGGN